jgi:hypothetical protein
LLSDDAMSSISDMSTLQNDALSQAPSAAPPAARGSFFGGAGAAQAAPASDVANLDDLKDVCLPPPHPPSSLFHSPFPLILCLDFLFQFEVADEYREKMVRPRRPALILHLCLHCFRFMSSH